MYVPSKPMSISSIIIKSPVAAEILKKTRSVKGITLKDLSEKTGLSEGYLSLLERVQRPMSKKNFSKIFQLGFLYTVERVDELWEEIVKNTDGQKNIELKTLASSKFRVRNLGFNHWSDDEDGSSGYYITCRWTILGKIYSWTFHDDKTNYLHIKNPLTSEQSKTIWQQVYNQLGRSDALGLLEAIYDEIVKSYDDVEKEREREILDYAVPEIEDIRDAIESMPIPDIKYASDIKVEDLPF